MSQIPLAVRLLGFLITTSALADPHPSTQGYTALGPYLLSAPYTEAGNCGNVWAQFSTGQTSYRVYPERGSPGSYLVEQHFAVRGQTRAGLSMSCQKSVGAGIAVTQDDVTIVRITGTFNPKGTCQQPCFFAQFEPAFFGATRTATPLALQYFYNTEANGHIVMAGSNPNALEMAGDIQGENAN
ncbi:MAG: hypothetical protein WCP04_13485 [Pseudomonadota bacterium]|jgi:hypothetical protein